MSSHWSRRGLLAALGTAALAGCGGGDGETTGESPSSTRQSTVGTPSPPREAPDPPDTLDTAWPVPDAEPGGSNYAAGAVGPTEAVARLWETDVGGASTAPVVAGETLYVGVGDTLHALDARTGDRRWDQSVPGTVETPWVAGDSVYVPTDNGVAALATEDGGQRWHREFAGFETAMVADDGVYALTDDAAPAVVALDADGDRRWRTAIGDPWTPHLFASDESVFVSTGGRGTGPWQLTAGTGAIVGERPGGVTDGLYPRFYRDGTVFSSEFLPTAVDASPVTDGGHGWQETVAAGSIGVMSGGPDHVYASVYGGGADDSGDQTGLYALSLADGSRQWSVTAFEIDGRPAVADDVVVVPTVDALRGFDPSEGTRQWSVPGEDIGGSVIVADDLVYTTGDGAVRAFRPR